MAKEPLIHLFDWSPHVYVDPFHTHDHLEIGYCLSGSGTFYFGDKTFPVQQGDVFVVNHLERHAAASNADNPSRYLFLYFDPTLIEQADQELLLPFVYLPTKFQNRIPSGLKAARKIGELFLELADEHENKQPGYRGMMRGKILQICVQLLRHYVEETPSADWNRTLTSYYRIKPALDYINERFREPLSLEDVAERLALSPSRARHLFQEKLGTGFKQYLLQLRVNEAKKLLASSDLPIADVMYAAGFQSPGPFYRAFKQIVGAAPLDYREQAAKLALFEKISGENKTTREALPR
ncbi:AraC-type DNA-binding protein [Paenibacillus uliginis N3/975]|uniref:AraC-type DNA-binding protein n=1 Tax=Paenibacillus uliginis N3/975 TaxID=1313296 RepID=A0A1X7HF83_9BACL|nr:AraC family transcriptional regulator [Paenibacillus uliginis]SMF84501.1 AraC-type DNA-binding protein [Paenibacillus uliginis N3/975]